MKPLVPRRGLEPPRCYPLVPETSASTNSATWAQAATVTGGLFGCQLVRQRPVQRRQPSPYTRGGRSCIRRSAASDAQIRSEHRYTYDRTSQLRHARHRLSAARVSSADTWCARWRSADTASGSRCAGPNSPVSCSRSAGLARFMPCRPTCAIRNLWAAARDADVVDQSRRHPFRARPAALRRRTDRRGRSCSASSRGLSARAWCMCRRSAPTRTSPSSYARTKVHGREARAGRRTSATILRPSIMFGPDDDFFNRFAALARFAPALPLVGGGETRFQPVFVGDVAEPIAKAVDGRASRARPMNSAGRRF